MDTWTQDLRYALRAVKKAPGFTAIAVLTLALGIGVNSAIFSIVNVLLFSELPIENPEKTAFIWSTHKRQNLDRESSTPADFFAWREESESFAGLTALQQGSYVLTGWKEATRVAAALVSENLFDVWGLPVAPGRDFLPGEELPGAARATILAHGFWRRHFGGDPEVVGKSFLLDGVEHTVVGVASPEIEFGDLKELDLWVPLGMDRASAPRDQRTLLVVGRLKPGSSVRRAHEEISLISARLAEEYPDTHRGWSARVVSFSEGMVNRNTWVILVLLSVMVGFVLLIACINVANMLLSRATSRAKEMAVRGALGAGRWRLLRQLLTENLWIAAGAAALGLALAQILLKAMQAITSHRDPFFQMLEIDGNVLLFTSFVAILAPLIFGLLPSLRASRPNLQQALRETAATAGRRRGSRSRGILVTAQIAMALMLMVTAGLVTRTVIHLQSVELGFDSRNLLTMKLGLPETNYGDDSSVRLFFNHLVEEIRRLPGAVQASVVSHRPLDEEGPAVPLSIFGREMSDDREPLRIHRYIVGPGFFETLGVPLLRGRSLTAADTAETPGVAVISESAARTLWPGEDPLGERLRLGTDASSPWIEIVGIAGNIGTVTRQELSAPQIYLPFEQHPTRQMALIVKTAGEEMALAPPIRREVWSLDATQPVDDVRTMTQIHYDSMASSYALVMLFLVFAGFALFMSAIGLYGVTSYAVSQRTQEIGIRMALGAEALDVAKMIFRQGIGTVATGTLFGLLGAWLLSRTMRGVVSGISTVDPLTFLSVPALLVAVALVANFIPTRRATRIDPVTSLRIQ